MEKEALTPCTTRKERDFLILLLLKCKKKEAPNEFSMLKLSYAAGNSKYIFIYPYMYIKKGKIIYL